MKLLKHIPAILFGLMFVFAGITKFVSIGEPPKLSEEQLKAFQAFATIKWLLPLVGVIEILGGILFVIPKTRALGALVIFPLMVGILIHNIVYFYDIKAFAMTAILFAVNVWVLYDNKDKYKEIF